MNGLISQSVFDWQVLILVTIHTLYPFYLRKHQKLIHNFCGQDCEEGVSLIVIRGFLHFSSKIQYDYF